MTAEDFAWEIIGMAEEIRQLKHENGRLRKYEADYHKLLNESVAHGEQMMAGWLQYALRSEKSETSL